MSERLLVVVAHPDDEVIMCGGTIAKFASYGREVRVLVIADGVTSRGAGIDAVMERVAMGSKASDVLGSNGQILGWGDQRIDTVPALDLNKVIELYPQCSMAYRNRGVSWIWLNEPDKALADYSRAIDESGPVARIEVQNHRDQKNQQKHDR